MAYSGRHPKSTVMPPPGRICVPGGWSPGRGSGVRRGPLEQVLGGGELGKDFGGAALPSEHGGALAGVDVGGVVITRVTSGCQLGLRAGVGLEVLFVTGPAVGEPVAQRPATVLGGPCQSLGDIEHTPVGGAGIGRVEQ